MELVYLWVEEYKNIKNQGFNFSPRFTCKYENNMLTICDKKEKECQNNDYIEDFFGKNINITAIVGKNGSGKSGILETLLLLLFGVANPDPNNCALMAFCIFTKGGKYFFKFSNAYDIIEQNKIVEQNSKILEREFDTKKVLMMHYNYSLDTISTKFKQSVMSSEYDGFIYDYETTPNQNNIFSQPKKAQSIIDIKKLNRESQKHMIKISKNFGERKLNQIFDNIFQDENNIKFIPSSFILYFDYSSYFTSFNDVKIRKAVQNYFENTKHYNIDIQQLTKLANVFFIFRLFESSNMVRDLFYDENKTYVINTSMITILKDIEKKIYLDSHEILESDNKEDKILLDNNFIDTILQDFDNNVISNGSSIITNVLGSSIQTLFPNIYDTAWYIDYIQGKFEKLQKHDVRLFQEKTTINSDLIEQLIKNLPSFVEIELWNKKDVPFSDLSYGEKVINRFFYNIFTYFDFYHKKEFTDFKIFLDEIEIGLHPEWQKKFFNFTIKICESLIKDFPNTNIHLFFSTHSPFILSDIPKQNILFLKDGENVNKDISIETFGANIHTLLSHGFFMNGRLMGEFAKNKINDVIDYLNGKENSPIKDHKEAKKIINIIGEPVLKSTLQAMLHSKETKLDKLKRQKKELEQAIKLEEEKAKSNETN